MLCVRRFFFCARLFVNSVEIWVMVSTKERAGVFRRTHLLASQRLFSVAWMGPPGLSCSGY